MKKLFLDYIWQWRGGSMIGFNPIGIEFEYDKFEPAMAFKFVLMGIGFQVIWICPWETEESIYAKESLGTMYQIISFDQIEDKDDDAEKTAQETD